MRADGETSTVRIMSQVFVMNRVEMNWVLRKRQECMLLAYSYSSEEDSVCSRIWQLETWL